MPKPKRRLANGLAIEKLRCANGWNQDVLAANLHCGLRWVQKVENYGGFVEEPRLRSLAELFGVPFEEIVVPEGQEMAYLRPGSGVSDLLDDEDEWRSSQTAPGDSAVAIIEVNVENDGEPWTPEADNFLLQAIRNLRATTKPFVIRFPATGPSQ